MVVPAMLQDGEILHLGLGLGSHAAESDLDNIWSQKSEEGERKRDSSLTIDGKTFVRS